MASQAISRHPRTRNAAGASRKSRTSGRSIAVLTVGLLPAPRGAQATSGISCSDEAIDAFNSFKLRKGGRFIVFKIGPHPETKEDQVLVEAEGASDASYDDMLAKFPDDDCRYAVFDYQYEQDGRQQDKIVFVNWWVHPLGRPRGAARARSRPAPACSGAQGAGLGWHQAQDALLLHQGGDEARLHWHRQGPAGHRPR